MTKKLLTILLVCLMAISVVSFVACDKDNNNGGEAQNEEHLFMPGVDDVEEAKPSLTMPTSVNIDLGDSVTLVPTIKNATGTPVWTSQNSQIASVVDGVITANSLGSTQVTATLGELVATATVTVLQPTAAPVLQLDRDSAVVAKNGQITVNADVLWKTNIVSDATVTWSFADGAAQDVVTIAQDDGLYSNNVVISGIKEGTTTLVASCTYRNVQVSRSLGVEVKNLDIILDIGGATKTAQGEYVATVNTVDATDGDKVYSTVWNPYLNLSYLNQSEEASNANWTIVSGSEYVQLQPDGMFKCIKEGSATLQYTYHGVTTAVLLNCVRPTFVLSNANEVIDISAPRTITITESLYGTVNAASFKGVDIFGSFSGGVLTFDTTKLSHDNDGTKLGKGQFLVETPVAKYLINGELYSKIIKNASDLNVLKTATNGYYILDADIAYNGDWTTTITATTSGFAGIFDGQGHNVAGFHSVTAGGGLFGKLAEGSKVCNVSFTDAQALGSAIICSAGAGEISNVYVQLTKLTASSGSNYAGVFFTNGASSGASVTNCFVDASSNQCGVATSATNVRIIGSGLSSSKVYTNTFAIAYNSASMGKATSNIYTKDTLTVTYATNNGKTVAANYTSLAGKIAEVIASFDAELWTLDAKGLLIFANLVK